MAAPYSSSKELTISEVVASHAFCMCRRVCDHTSGVADTSAALSWATDTVVPWVAALVAVVAARASAMRLESSKVNVSRA